MIIAEFHIFTIKEGRVSRIKQIDVDFIDLRRRGFWIGV